MHSFSRSLLGLGALTLAGCGAPAELDESRFPGLDQTGYPDALSPTGSTAGGGNGSPSANAGASGSGGMIGSSGTGNVGLGGSAPVAAGGNGSVSAGGSQPTGQGGSAQGGSPSTGGGSGQTGNDACPEDITVLFARPGAQGGCDGAGCHMAGGQRPDLVSPGVETRLVDVASNCQGLPYISAGDSFLEDKLTGSPPRCGFAMPLGARMPDEDKQCVLDWIAEVSGG